MYKTINIKTSSIIVKEEPNVPNKRYKTELCRHFQMNLCLIGSNCQYAHGKEELRSLDGGFFSINLDPVPNGAKLVPPHFFKTGTCCRYGTLLDCPDGQRCQYIHSIIIKKNYNSGGQPNLKLTLANSLKQFIALDSADHPSSANYKHGS